MRKYNMRNLSNILVLKCELKNAKIFSEKLVINEYLIWRSSIY